MDNRNPPITQEQAQDIADRLFTALAAGDLERVREVYAPDGTIWNNHTPQQIGVDDLITMLAQMRTSVDKMWFEPVRTQVTATGFVDQHVTHIVTKKGAAVALSSCMVVRVRDGRIAAVEEYSNPADMAPLIAELMEAPSAPQ